MYPFLFFIFIFMIVGLKDKDALKRIVVKKSYPISNKQISFESGRLALFATGSVVIEDGMGNFLLTTCGIGNPKDGDFFPLTVEFQEKYYAAGKIGGNRFMKREGRPSEASILNSRMIDRPIRPMFPKGTRTDTQIISTIMSSSGLSDFGWYGITGASLSVMLAGVTEFEGPVAGVRIASDESGNFIFDPTFDQIEKAHLDLTVAGTLDAITMVESQGSEVSNELMVRAFEYAHAIIKTLCHAQIDFVNEYKEIHALPTTTLTVGETDESVISSVASIVTDADIRLLYGLGKLEFHDALHDLVETVAEKIGYDKESNTPKMGDIADSVKDMVKTHMRKTVIETRTRLDGRATDEVRPVRASAPILPRAHGSTLFERGVTQVLSVTTLGGPGDIQLIDDMFEEDTKRYIHHYNFPPFSVGEVKPLRGVGRREVGHGRLAEKALEPVLPNAIDFPYMMRVVSETTTCNGSSSMASVCGSTLALMDAGVPLKAMVAGVAMGMIYEEETGRYEILADIQAQEDFLGDMDFKVARTDKGITALQMDCKIAGLSMEVIKKVFDQSIDATGYIMGEMKKCLAEPRKELSPYAPFLLSVFVPEEKMREVIGKGGETIQGIEKEFGVEVNLEDSGTCTITAKDQVSGRAALEFIRNILKDIEVGDIYDGKIIKVLDTVGAIVEIARGKEGMIHISKFGVKERIENVNNVAKVGEIVKVKVYSVDKEKGRIGLEKIVETPV
ncbi:polyribonucleotide nucleotidyltransferase [Candidatus Gracilibacteria bacterium]|nr:polyribonucleotide nucleotidyltransferase [Candidatus Gracilibacteria bacterium]